MDVMTAIKGRRSVRSYLPKEVEPEKLKAVLEAARLAPSARNLQNWKFIAVTDKNTIRRLTEACNNQTFVEKPCIYRCLRIKRLRQHGMRVFRGISWTCLSP